MVHTGHTVREITKVVCTENHYSHIYWFSERHPRSMLVLMSVGMLSFVITRRVCSLLTLDIWYGDTVSLLLVFGIMSFSSFPTHSWRRKGIRETRVEWTELTWRLIAYVPVIFYFTHRDTP